jgi:hypothetical protein
MRRISLLHLLFVGMAAFLFAACEKSPILPEKDARMEFLRNYYPHLRALREQVAADILFCRNYSSKLSKLRSTFDQEESKKVIDMKLFVLKEQCALLEKHLNQIDTEAEKGIARKTINDIDGGGTRLPALSQLSERCTEAVQKTRRLSAEMQRDHLLEKLPDQVPRVVPVNAPRVVPVSVPE